MPQSPRPDPTEAARRELVGRVNSSPRTIDEYRLEYGDSNVWDTRQLGETFVVLGFMAPFAVVRRRSDGVVGSVMFQHSPRVYWGFQPD